MENLEQERLDGSMARDVLENEMFHEAFISLEAQILGLWHQTTQRQFEERELLWTELKLLQRLEGILRVTMENGKIAERNIEDLKLNKH